MEAKSEQTPKELSIDKKIGLFDYLKADLNRAKKIDQSLKTGKRVKIENGEILDPKTQRGELEELKGYLSDDIIKYAGELSGVNLKKEAAKATGYKFDKDPEKQKEWRQWLTKEVNKIFKDTENYFTKTRGWKVKAGAKIKPVIKRNDDIGRDGPTQYEF